MKKIKTERKGRRCVICGHILSVYNEKNICFHHQEIIKDPYLPSYCTKFIPHEELFNVTRFSTHAVYLFTT